jgi:tetratricopeptide (TPR) repeat protein
LQKAGYSDVAIDYLDRIKADPNAPKEILDLWDLEMSRSKKDAAKQAYNNEQAKQWTEESKALLERFIKANPTRPEAIQEAAAWSLEQAEKAQTDVLLAAYATSTVEKAKLLAEARKLFEEIRPRFVDALKASIKLLTPLRRNATPREIRQHTYFEVMVGENRSTVAMVDFYLAQTLEDSSQRTAALTKSTKDFDAIYQAYREAYDDPGKAFLACRAHFFHARILQELGQYNESRAVFEEVLAFDRTDVEEPDSKPTGRGAKAAKTGLEGFFADVEHYYLQVLYQLNKKDYSEEVKKWRVSHKANSETCAGFQALTFEYAKHWLDFAQQSKDPAYQKTATAEALRLLGEMAKIPSPWQEPAIKLRRQLNPNGTPEEGFEDAVIDGDAAVGNQNWKEAAECYEKALAAAGPKTDKARLAAVENTLVACYHNLGAQLYRQGKIEEAMAMAKKAGKVPDFLQTKAAPGVTVFLLNVQYYQYLGAVEKTEAEKTARGEMLKKLSTTAQFILNHWAAKEEGDAARIVLMRLALGQANIAEESAAEAASAAEKASRLAQAQAKMAEADKILSEINPASKEYPKALTVMGFAHWYKYKVAKKQLEPEEERMRAEKAKKAQIDKAALAAFDKAKVNRDEHRRLALDFIEKAVNELAKGRVENAAIPEALRESQLLLAEIYSEGEDFKKAWELYKPLLDEIIKDSNKAFDETALRIFTGAGQACLKLGDVENAASVGGKFLELAPDQGQINRAVMSFAVGLERLRKNALAESTSGDLAEQNAGAAKLSALTALEQKVLIDISKREHLLPSEMIWIVKTSSNLGTDDAKSAAAALIKRIIDKSFNDKEFDDQIKDAKPALQSLGAQLLAEQGKYDEALDLIEQLLQTYPRKLDLRISKAKILTTWAAKDPSKYDNAVATWDNLRKWLDRVKPPPGMKLDPKYEVIYCEVDCLLKMAQKTNNKETAKTGMELLMPYLNLDEKIRYPNEEYKEISAKFFQLGDKVAS